MKYLMLIVVMLVAGCATVPKGCDFTGIEDRVINISNPSHGTGFIVSPTELLTAYHVHEDQMINVPEIFISGSTSIQTIDYSKFDIQYHTLSTIPYRAPLVGDLIYYYGYPFDSIELYSSVGRVTAVDGIRFNSNSYVAGGMSGGPILTCYNNTIYYSGFIYGYISNGLHGNLGILIGVSYEASNH